MLLATESAPSADVTVRWSGNVPDVRASTGTRRVVLRVGSRNVRVACAASIFGHADTLEADFAEALAQTANPADVTAASLARFTQTVLQGAFVLSKAADDPALVIESIDHLRRYLEFLFRPQGD